MRRILDNTALNSPLNSHSILNPKGANSKKSLVSTLILTSLVDAFSILVIYLLVTTSGNGEQVDINKDIKLPTVTKSDAINKGITLVIKGNQFLIDEKSYTLEQLFNYLGDQSLDKQVKSLIIQADKKMNFEILSPILMGAGKAGFTKVQFAVQQEGT